MSPLPTSLSADASASRSSGGSTNFGLGIRATLGDWSALYMAVLLLANTPLFARALPIAAADQIELRAGLTALILTPVVWLKERHRPSVWRSSPGWILLSGILMAGHWVTYFLGVQQAGIALGMASFFTFPLTTALLEPLFERRRIHADKVVVPALAFVGLVVAIFATPARADLAPLGALWGFASGICFSLRNILVRRIMVQHSGLRLMHAQTVVTALLLLPFTWETTVAGEWLTYWPALLTLSLICTATAHTLLATSLRSMSARTVGIVSSLQPVIGIATGAWLLHETPPLSAAIGALIVVATALHTTVTSFRRHGLLTTARRPSLIR